MLVNLNKSEKAHLDLINGPLGTDWDIVLLQELHVTKFSTIQTPWKFQQVYSSDRRKADSTVHSAIWVNSKINTKSWEIITIPNTNDITSIQL